MLGIAQVSAVAQGSTGPIGDPCTPVYGSDDIYICHGQTYSFNGQKYVAGSSFLETLRSADGCDSIVTHNLRELSVTTLTETVELPGRGGVTLYGHEINKEGLTVIREPYAAYGCDSVIHQIVATRRPAIYQDVTLNTCAAQLPIIWYDSVLTEVGTYLYYIGGDDQQDIYERLTLTMDPVTSREQYYVCDGDSVEIHGVYYKETSSWNDTLTLATGCDSVITYQIQVVPQYHIEEERTFSSREEFMWHGHKVSVSGDYFDSHTSIYGCDSSYVLHATVLASYVSRDTLWFCENVDFEVKDHRWLEKDTIFPAAMDYIVAGGKTAEGQDSIYVISIQTKPISYSSETREIALGDSIEYRDRYVKAPGIYVDTLINSVGCDSIHTLYLNGCTEQLTHLNLEICAGDSVEIGGIYRHETGLYHDTLQTITGCDSILTYHLSVRSSVDQTVYEVHLCPGQSFTYHDKVFDKSGTFTDTLTNRAGCDSLVRFQVSVLPSYYFEKDTVISDQQTFMWHDQLIDRTKTYYDNQKTIDGCDSVYVLNATVHPTYYYQEPVTICESDLPYKWHGRDIASAGVYTDPYHTKAGYDSIYTLTLTVNPTHAYVEHYTICQGSELTLRGKKYSVAASYNDTLRNHFNCDSIITVVISYASSFYHEDRANIHKDGTYLWSHNDQIYTHQGVYWDSLKTVDGCDSIYKLILLEQDYFYEDKGHITLCSDQLPYQYGKNKFLEKGFVGTKTLYDSLLTADGRDSVYRLTVTVNPAYYTNVRVNACENEGFKLHDKLYTRNQTILDTIPSVDGCDSVVAYNLYIAPSYRQEIFDTINPGESRVFNGLTLTRDTVITINPKTSGYACDSVTVYHLKVNPSYRIYHDSTVCSSELPFDWYGIRIEDAENRDYYKYGITTAGADSTHVLRLKVNPAYEYSDYIRRCKGEKYEYRHFETGMPIQIIRDTVITETRHTADGCDSIRHLHVIFNDTYLFIEDTITTCSNEPVTWQGRQWKDKGWHEVSYQSQNGCDSTYRFYLNVQEAFIKKQEVTICEDELVDGHYTWRNHILRCDTMITDSFTIHDTGCDSLYVLDFHISKRCSEVDTFDICPDGDITIHGVTYTKEHAGNHRYNWAEHSDSRIDSVYRFYIRVAPTYEVVDDTTVCANLLPFYLYNTRISKAGVYDLMAKTRLGCDSLIHMTVNVLDTVFVARYENICEGSYVSFGGKRISETGIYFDTTLRANGCDSVTRLTLNVMPHHEIPVIETTIREGASYRFHRNGQERILTQDGIYFDSCVNRFGCDSIYKLILHVEKNMYFPELQEMCEGDTYLWHCQELTSPGTYFDSLHRVHGADSVYELHLSVWPSPVVDMPITKCMGDEFYIGTRLITESGIYWDSTLQTIHGCDSIVRYIVNFTKPYRLDTVVKISDKQSFYWSRTGQTYTTRGDYDYVMKSMTGCDSIIRLHLEVYPTYLIERDTVLCADEAPFYYADQDREYFRDTLIVDSLKTIHGFDSVVIMDLHIMDKIAMTTRQMTICQGSLVEVEVGNKTYYRGPGTYQDTLVSHTGCDSIVRMVINQSQRYIIPVMAKMCVGTTYTWRGHKDEDGNDRVFTHGGIYYEYNTTVQGCDSIYELHLDEVRNFRKDTMILVCASDGAYQAIDGGFYEKDTTIEFHHAAASHCDSIYSYHYRVTDNCPKPEVIDLCDGNSVNINGETVTEGGIYAVPYWSVKEDGSLRYDSLKRYVVHKHPSYLRIDTVFICHGSSYTYKDQVFTTLGTHDLTYKTQFGCDSIYRLVLRSYPTYRTHEPQADTTIRDFETYEYRGTIYYGNSLEKGSNIITHTEQTQNGCDSLFQAYVTVIETDRYGMNDDAVHICKTELPYAYSKFFPSRLAYRAGTYYDTIYNPKAGISEIYYYHIAVDEPSTIVDVTPGDICQNGGPDTLHTTFLPLSFSYTGEAPDGYMISFERKAYQQGFKDQQGKLDFRDNSFELEIPGAYGSGLYVRPDVYEMYITFTTGSCSSAYPLPVKFTVPYPSWIIEQLYNDAVAVLRPEHNGGYTFSKYEWYVNGDYYVQDVSLPYLKNARLYMGDEVVLRATRQGEMYAIESCPIEIKSMSGTGHITLAVDVVGQGGFAGPRRARIHTSENGTYHLLTVAGRLVSTGAFTNGTMVPLPSSEGCYLLRLETKSGEILTEKVLAW